MIFGIYDWYVLLPFFHLRSLCTQVYDRYPEWLSALHFYRHLFTITAPWSFSSKFTRFHCPVYPVLHLSLVQGFRYVVIVKSHLGRSLPMVQSLWDSRKELVIIHLTHGQCLWLSRKVASACYCLWGESCNTLTGYGYNLIVSFDYNVMHYGAIPCTASVISCIYDEIPRQEQEGCQTRTIKFLVTVQPHF